MAVFTIRRTVAGRSELLSNFRNGERRVACFEARRCAEQIARRVPTDTAPPIRVRAPDRHYGSTSTSTSTSTSPPSPSPSPDDKNTDDGETWFSSVSTVQVEEMTFARISADMGVRRVPVDLCIVVDDDVKIDRSLVLVSPQNATIEYTRRRLELDFTMDI